MAHRSVVVREATSADAEALARVHVSSWQVAYRGLVPNVVLDSLSVERRTVGWVEWLSEDPSARRNLEGLGRIVAKSKTWTAEQDGRIVAFVNAGACRDDDVDEQTGEVFAIYAAPEVWDAGVGAALMEVALAWLREEFTSAVLWVLEGNERGRRFYEAGGWAPDGQVKKLDFAGTDLNEVRYRLDLRARA